MNLRLVKKAWRLGRAATRRIVIQNYREYCAAAPSGRALVSYLTLPLLPPRRFRDRVIFSPFGIAQEIPRALNEMGYAVDVVNYDNSSWRPQARYDLFIGHGSLNTERLREMLAPQTRKICFASGLYWKEWNRRAAQRTWELACRTGWLLPSERSVVDEDCACSLEDGILHLGNRQVAQSFAPFGRTHGINNAAYPVNWEGFQTKDYEAGRRHFLFFQGPGNVHKGLDRVLEAFSCSPFHLHVCQEIEPAFARAYERLLFRSPNIHVYGFIRQRSKLFYELASRCDWVLSATCAEGQPGAIVEMMAHGLIPILPDSANIDLGEWGVRLPDCSPGAIADACASAAEQGGHVCREMAEVIMAETRRQYSVEHFRASFQEGVRALCAGNVPGGEGIDLAACRE